MKTQHAEYSRESCISVVEKWTKREFQLHRLHEERLSKRESLLRTCEDYFKQKNHRGANDCLKITNSATLRNQYLMQDIEELQEDISKENLNNPTTRFVTLEKNYMAMMNGILQIWEKDIQRSRKKKQEETTTTPNPIPRNLSKFHRSAK